MYKAGRKYAFTRTNFGYWVMLSYKLPIGSALPTPVKPGSKEDKSGTQDWIASAQGAITVMERSIYV